jgi:hypothetical protein
MWIAGCSKRAHSRGARKIGERRRTERVRCNEMIEGNEGYESFVAVGTPVDPTPPAQIRTCRIAAYGSYLRYLAPKRTFGCGCRIFALGIQRSTNGQNRSQVIRSRWLRRRSARCQRQIT